MFLSDSFNIALPLTDPVLKFMVILIIILFAPLILNKVKIPYILGLIIAGAVIGPNGLNILPRDSNIIISGTAGLLYIMFLAGLDINLDEFRKNSYRSLLFGFYTFLIPMALGLFAGIYLLNFSIRTSILLASMFASHTLIAYPVLSKFGVTKNRAVTISVGGTMITDTLSLLVLAVIVGMSKGEVNSEFWIKLLISFIVFATIVIFLFPVITRWFFKNFNDSVAQYIFILVMVYLGAVLAKAAGIEAIIGAFLTGLALNRLIPSTSPLMNRIEFVGNAIFIPFFLIGVGMLIDYKAFFTDFTTLKVAAVMTIIATTAKFIAAWLAQKTFRFSIDERRLIFGLSNAQAAATLAAVLVGYNIILGYTPQGDPVRLLNDSILNGTIVMILITCTIATFTAQKGARNISLSESQAVELKEPENEEKILIPVSNQETIEELIGLSIILKSKENKNGLFALNIINNNISDSSAGSNAKRLLDKALIAASSADIHLNKLLRYDQNVVNGITSVIKEHNITDLILGLHIQKGFSESFLGNLTEGILTKSNASTFVYRSVQPISTLKRHLIIVPANAEDEIGFPFWLVKVWNIARNTGARLLFYGTDPTIKIIRGIHSKHPIEADFNIFDNWNDFLILARDVRVDDCLVIILSRVSKPSFHINMSNVPGYLNKYFQLNSYILIYPIQGGVTDTDSMDMKNPSLLEPIEKLDELGKTISRIFKRK